MLVVTGPAGSGKTTTIYALLQHIAATAQGLSIVSLEDPVERKLPGVTQIEVSPFGELTYERTLRSILRQDPQYHLTSEERTLLRDNLPDYYRRFLHDFLRLLNGPAPPHDATIPLLLSALDQAVT